MKKGSAKPEAKLWFVTGRVQGVGFRYFVQKEATRLGLTGYAKNLADGRVEVLAAGPLPDLEELEGLLRRGPLWSDVRHLEARETAMVNYEGFHIK